MITETNTDRWIDATGCLRWGPQNPTGVPRVEMKIAAAALSHPDFKLAYLDRTFGVYRPCTDEDIAHLRELVDIFEAPQTSADLAFYWRNRASVIKNFEAETGRNIAALLTKKPTRKGMIYTIAKTGVRALVNGAKLIYRSTGWLPFAGKTSQAIPSKSALLISHIVDRREMCSRAITRQELYTRYMVHDIIPLKEPETHPARMVAGFRRWLLRAGEEKAALICVSKGTADDVNAWYALQDGATLPAAVNVCALTGVGLRVDGPTEPVDALVQRKFALYISTFNPRKNHDFLVEVWARLIDELGEDQVPELVLIGRDKPYKALVAALERHPLAAAKVRNLGSVSNETLRWAYQNCAFVVFPSSAEGWGIGVTEALRFGKPAIHTDTPQLNEAGHGLMPALPDRDLDRWTAQVSSWLNDEKNIEPFRLAAQKLDETDNKAFETCVLSALKA
ncbi:MAG: glycosyltransferase [Pseudomonadota bacterium]